MQIMSWLTRAMAARGEAPSVAETITVGDGHRQFRVMIEPGVPEDAYHQLFHLDLPESAAGVLFWDDKAGTWRMR
jgi:hypothetical protein